MSATLFINPTAMEAGLLAAAHARGLSGARAAAFERFSRTGLPHRRMEGWRWSDFRQALRAEIAPALVGDEVIAPASFSGLDAFELTIMNGQAEWEADAPAGVSVAFSEPGPLGAALEDHPFANLCAALAGPTVAIRIEDDIARPLHIRRIVGAGASHARLSLALADGASATIIESFDGVGAYFATSVTEATLGDGARLARDVLQDGSDTGAEAAIFSARLGSRAELHQMALLFGARASRMENRIEFAGPGARAELRSAAALSDQRHSDHTTHVAHKAEGCETRQLHKSALRDRSHGVFQGKFLVARGAQRTDARMTANALLLSRDAEASHKPELEIYADDVQCAHGSTAGALDDEALFYMRQRGLNETAARALLVEAFLAEVFEGAERINIAEIFRARMRAWLGAGT